YDNQINKEAQMKTILLPVDGSESALRAAKVALQQVRESDKTQIHLITVQTPIASGNVKRFFTAETLNAYYQDEGQNALASARALLNEAGITYEESIKVGPIAQTIADYAKKHQCDQIIMGTRGLGSVTGLVLGSVTV